MFDRRETLWGGWAVLGQQLRFWFAGEGTVSIAAAAAAALSGGGGGVLMAVMAEF